MVQGRNKIIPNKVTLYIYLNFNKIKLSWGVLNTHFRNIVWIIIITIVLSTCLTVALLSP